MESFEIIKTLGKGTFGRVELAMHKQTQQLTAIKILLKSKIKSPQDHTHIARQISILKHLKHPNIVKLLYHFEDQTAIYLVMQHCQNGDLLHYLKDNKKIKQKEAIKIIYQLVDGIKYMHDNKVAHRDIKLGNILLDKNLTVKIADFGLSNFYEPGSKLKTSCGSPCFASPEVIAGNPYEPRKSDVWSIGVVFYTLLAGTLPFYHENIFDLYSMVFNGVYHHINGITKNASDLISKLLQVDISKRIQLSSILSHNLFQTYKKIKKLVKQKDQNKQLELKRGENIKQILTQMQIPQKEIKEAFKQSSCNQAYFIKELFLKMDDEKFSTYVQSAKKQKRLNKSGLQIIKIKRNPLNIANNQAFKKSIIFKSIEDQHDQCNLLTVKDNKNGGITQRSSVSSQLGKLQRKSQQNVFVRSAKRIVRKSVLNCEKAETYIKLKTTEQKSQVELINRRPLTNKINTLNSSKMNNPVLSMHNSSNQIQQNRKKSVDKRKMYVEETRLSISKNTEIVNYYGPYNIENLIYNNADYIRYRIQKISLKGKEIIKITQNTFELISKENQSQKRSKLSILRLNGIQGIHLLQIQPHCSETLSEVLKLI